MKFKIITLFFALLSNFNVFCMDHGYEEDSQDYVNSAIVQRVFNFEDFQNDPFNEKNFEAITEVNDLVRCLEYFKLFFTENETNFLNLAKRSWTIAHNISLLKGQDTSEEIKCCANDLIAKSNNFINTLVDDLSYAVNTVQQYDNAMDAKTQIDIDDFVNDLNGTYAEYLQDVNTLSAEIRVLKGTLRLLIEENAAKNNNSDTVEENK